jgi:hypothetical protein
LSERETVRDFLQLVKETIANPVVDEGWLFVARPENNQCLLDLEFKYKDVKEALLSLSVDDYSEGPTKDRKEKGDIWIFGKEIRGKTVYIKIKLASFGPIRIVRVISFHFAEYPIEYPFR